MRTKLFRARPVAVLATAAALAAGLCTPAAATEQQQTVARHGAGYLARAITAGGGNLSADVTSTAYAVLGLHAAGVGRQAAQDGVAYLSTQLGEPLKGADGQDDPGRVAYVVLAAVAGKQNPRRFGGENLVDRLLATQRADGLFGSAAPTYDGAFRQGLALTALKAAKVPSTDARIAAATTWLTGQQCANGLWQAYRADTAVPCAPADPATFSGPDTNSTGMAVQGLAAYGKLPGAKKVLAALNAARSADGGFAFVAAPGQASDPNSTALAIQAIVAAGGQPGNAYAALASFQLGCTDPAADRGAFFYPGSRAVNLLATVQAVPAAAGKAFPLAPSTPSAAVPEVPCAVSAQLAGTPGPCAGTSGVTVTVDFAAFGGAQETRCAPGAQASGVAALQNAGFTPTGTTRWGLAFVCRINALPTPAQDPCVNTPPATAYWAYYHANAGATAWTYSTQGASTYVPPLGSIEAWAFGNGATPTLTPTQVRTS
ncbi:terpene cyclase/mutase family protein [Amycolatopsis sp. 195334CR]|uniref:terpene cyclase/mutase family protein n=1 Tax=Amycolatopsis sp. 195334CR TaxID=2814588 RepID=UPI001A8C5403|nr:terpene cyclase/mutase family protein [Amycolatopsis sp. 195334CR]MBN6033809.1 terpene cyclase/mutase family protein [Amycolatopsis sp. 195334CR]